MAELRVLVQYESTPSSQQKTEIESKTLSFLQDLTGQTQTGAQVQTKEGSWELAAIILAAPAVWLLKEIGAWAVKRTLDHAAAAPTDEIQYPTVPNRAFSLNIEAMHQVHQFTEAIQADRVVIGTLSEDHHGIQIELVRAEGRLQANILETFNLDDFEQFYRGE